MMISQQDKHFKCRHLIESGSKDQMVRFGVCLSYRISVILSEILLMDYLDKYNKLLVFLRKPIHQ